MKTFVYRSVLGGLSLLLYILYFFVARSAFANYGEIDAANKLATLGVIVDQSAEPSAYRFGDTTSREELSKIIAQLGGLRITEGESIFADDDFADWSEKYAKTLNEAGYAASNELFHPKNNSTKIEALKWVMEARAIATGTGSNWMEARVNGAVEAGIATVFTDYDAPVTRGQVFIWAVSAIDSGEKEVVAEDDMLCSILGTCSNSENSTAIGFTTGGEFGADYVRQSILSGKKPDIASLSYNAFLKDYSFSTMSGACENEFCPIFHAINLEHPISGKQENWIEMRLGSNIDMSDYERQKTNFVFVIDVSGSMGSSVASYTSGSALYENNSSLVCLENYTYFSPLSRCVSDEEIEFHTTNYESYAQLNKLEQTKKSLKVFIENLGPDDRVGIVLFNNVATIKHPLVSVEDIDLESLFSHIDEIQEGGSTNMQDGLEKGIDLFATLGEDDEAQNRMIFMTDALPNVGNTSEEGFISQLENAAENGIYTSFIGVGLSLNQELVSNISKIKGGNYFFVNSNYDIYRNLVSDFDYNFFPMFFDVELSLEGGDNIIEQVYGIDSSYVPGNALIQIHTLFPSAPRYGNTKGSIILIKIGDNVPETLSFNVSYTDLEGNSTQTSSLAPTDAFDETYLFQSDDIDLKNIKKALIVISYVDALKETIGESVIDSLDTIPKLFSEYLQLFNAQDRAVLFEDGKVIDVLQEAYTTSGDYWID